VSYRFVTTPALISRVQSIPGRLARVLGELFVFFSANYISRHEEGMLGAAVHDPLAVLAVTHPELFTRRARNVRIETRGEHTRGMTVIDQRTLLDRPAANCDVQTDVDAGGAWEAVIDAIASFST
jgi:inosine-uridine nucleoside N-ribohydrolase